MRKVLSFSGFLMLGLVVSQFLPMMAGDGYGAVKSISNVLLYVCLIFIWFYSTEYSFFLFNL